MSKQYTLEEVAKHNKVDDCWVVVHGKVYDVTKFLSEHPGGKKILLNEGGKEASVKFDQFHKKELLQNYQHLVIGEVNKVQATAAPKKEVPTVKKINKQAELFFGDLVPFGDPAWYQGNHTLFYTESHRKLRASIRDFMDKEVAPFCAEWDENKHIPRELIKKFGDAGFLPASVGFWPKQYVGDLQPPAGVQPEQWDAFHELILIQEMCRPGSGAILWFLCTLAIALPPILYFGSQYLKEKVLKPVLIGDKIASLCITEPSGGSDVANLKTEAKKTPCGKYYIVNGEKKWITNGANADFYTVAVRTGEGGMGGVSMLLIERNMPGVSARPMNCTGVWGSGTGYITFEDVKVPVENLIGKENEGFKIIMYNFNHERWSVAVQSIAFARVCYEEAFKYAHKRKTFGKPLIENPVIRAKLGNMARNVESSQAWLELLTLQMIKMSHAEAQIKLGGPLALIKAHSTLVLAQCSTEAANVFGGLGYTRGGQAEKVERLYRDTRAMTIGGGTEEILIDLAVRQAQKQYVTTSGAFTQSRL